MYLLIGVVLIITIAVSGHFTEKKDEKKRFNKGICPECGTKFDREVDEHGERRYSCPKCDNELWICYGVDKGR